MSGYHKIKQSIKDIAESVRRDAAEIELLAVSKTHPAGLIREVHGEGCRVFGENKVQEALAKMDELGGLEGVSFDLIGHLQTNKARQAVGKFRLIHSVDRLSLAQELDKYAKKQGIVQDILLQVSLAGEEQKSGIAVEGLDELFYAVMDMPNLRIKGLMTIPPYDEDAEKSRPYFRKLKQLFDKYQQESKDITVLSMGMSGDYHVAIEEGATLVRVGTAIFGMR